MAGAAGLTVLDIITEVLGILTVYAQGEPIDAADSATVLFTMRAMIDGWGPEALTVFAVASQQFSTTGGKQSYLAGPGSDVDWALPYLPAKFYDGDVQMVWPSSTPPLERQVDVVTLGDWEAIGIKGLSTGILTKVYPSYGAAAHTLNFYPVPNATIPVNLYLRQSVANVSKLSDVLALGPGYQEALTYELVMKSASKFGKSVPQWLPEALTDAKQKIKAANFEALYQTCDDAIVGSRGGQSLIGFYEGK